MKVLILHRRHSERGGWCDACGKSAPEKNVVAKVAIVTGDAPNAVVGYVKICRACALGIVESAGKSVQT